MVRRTKSRSSHRRIWDRKVLTAFIVPRGANVMTETVLSNTVREMAAELHPWIQQFLPQYMLPGAYIPLKSMPPASNSKWGRRKLQQLGAAYKMKEQRSREIIGPTHATDVALCQIWSDVLRCPVHEISTEDNFFQSWRRQHVHHEDRISLLTDRVSSQYA